MKFLLVLFFVSLFISSLSASSYAQQHIDTAVKPLGKGTVFQGKWRGYELMTYKVLSKTSLVDVKTGAVLNYNAELNMTQGSTTKFTPHSGKRPSGTNGVLKVGHKWQHTYKSGDVTWTRKCKVAKKGTFKSKYIIVSNAFQVKCANQRLDRPKGKRETIWLLEDFAHMLSYSANWQGGSMQFEIRGFQ